MVVIGIFGKPSRRKSISGAVWTVSGRIKELRKELEEPYSRISSLVSEAYKRVLDGKQVEGLRGKSLEGFRAKIYYKTLFDLIKEVEEGSVDNIELEEVKDLLPRKKKQLRRDHHIFSTERRISFRAVEDFKGVLERELEWEAVDKFQGNTDG